MRRVTFTRRQPVLALLVLAVAVIIRVASSSPSGDAAVFDLAPEPWIPEVPRTGLLESAWYCPGMPATGEPDVGGAVIISNPTETATQALVTFLSDSAPSIERVVDVESGGRVQVDVDAELSGTFVAVIVEILGGGGLVEQRAYHPSANGLGQSATPCATSMSSTWYLAEGYTVDAASDQVILSNPSADQVVVDVAFHTAQGTQRPAAFTGLPVPPRSVRVVDVAAPGAGARGESSVGVSVEAARGALVVGRALAVDDGLRGGRSVSLGSPRLSEQWWFADGDKGPAVSERYSIFNPTSEAVEVSGVFFVEGLDTGSVTANVSVPAEQVVVIEAGSIAGLPEGAHSAVFSTLAGRSITVDRAVTRVGGGGLRVTSVASGVPVRRDGLLPTTWFLAAGPSVPLEGGLVVINLDNVPAQVTVSAIGSAGLVEVAGLTEVEIGAASTMVLDLVDPSVLSRPLQIVSTGRILVERRLPSSGLVGSSWAIAGPACC
ncbi:MAG: DUF5719 family protein [Actinomycetota bacterium]|jgi:hypothetical protein|nr:DUF5719 family protein [Actinomycetota bacterium]MDA3014782.1 DUF5719 family protein [Actinomycetota bacterium]MDA3028473.1 DUF5719 family protein [Actinomycetota bacterium]